MGFGLLQAKNASGRPRSRRDVRAQEDLRKTLEGYNKQITDQASNLKHSWGESMPLEGQHRREKKQLKRSEEVMARLDGPLINAQPTKPMAPIIFLDFGLSGTRPPDLLAKNTSGGSSSCPNPSEK